MRRRPYCTYRKLRNVNVNVAWMLRLFVKYLRPIALSTHEESHRQEGSARRSRPALLMLTDELVRAAYVRPRRSEVNGSGVVSWLISSRHDPVDHRGN